MKTPHLTLAILLACALYATLGRAHAEPQPTLDRALVERLVRAQEAQTHALEALVRATERCHR